MLDIVLKYLNIFLRQEVLEELSCTDLQQMWGSYKKKWLTHKYNYGEAVPVKQFCHTSKHKPLLPVADLAEVNKEIFQIFIKGNLVMQFLIDIVVTFS